MAVALQANALVDPTDAQVAGFLKLTGAANLDTVTTLINRASDYCEGYCDRPLKQQTFTAIRFPAQCAPNLRPLATPIKVADPVSLSVDGVDGVVALTVWKAEADGDPALKDVIIGCDTPGVPTFFYRACGWRGSTPFPILATFTGGLATIPGDLQQACLLVAQTLQRQEKGASEVQSYGPGPVSQSVTYRADSLIPMWSKQVLDRYRVVPL